MTTAQTDNQTECERRQLGILRGLASRYYEAAIDAEVASARAYDCEVGGSNDTEIRVVLDLRDASQAISHVWSRAVARRVDMTLARRIELMAESSIEHRRAWLSVVAADALDRLDGRSDPRPPLPSPATLSPMAQETEQ